MRRKKPNISRLQKKADVLWRDVIHNRDKHRCRKCGKTGQLNAHHIIGRTKRSTRWDTDNGVLLCAYPCHNGQGGAHSGHPSFWRWLENEIGNKMLDELIVRGNTPVQVTVPFMETVIAGLEKEQEE